MLSGDLDLLGLTCRSASAQCSCSGSCCRQRDSGSCLHPAGRRIDPAQRCHGLVSERVSLVGYSNTVAVEVRLKDTKTHRQIIRSGYRYWAPKLLTLKHSREINRQFHTLHTREDRLQCNAFIQWISDTRSQGCTDLQSLVKCLVECNALCYICSLDRCTECDESQQHESSDVL